MPSGHGSVMCLWEEHAKMGGGEGEVCHSSRKQNEQRVSLITQFSKGLSCNLLQVPTNGVH